LRIDVIANIACSSTSAFVVALFQDSTANALAVSGQALIATSAAIATPLTHTMTAGTTSATTFKVRAGGNVAGTTTFNGVGGARFYGGVYASSITITEYAT